MPVDLREKPPFPDLIDNSSRAAFVKCPRSWMYGYLYSLTGLAPSVHLHAGGAFAKGLEVARKSYWQDGNPVAEAVRDGLGALIQAYGSFVPAPTRTGDKSLENVIRAYDKYLRELYPLDRDLLKPFKGPDDKYMIEFTFAIPTEIKNPSTGQPILYGGRADQIGFMHDALWVADEKTTGSLGESWADNWLLDSQFTGYCAAARGHGFPVAGAIVRGMGLLKRSITHQEVMCYRPDWMIDRWWWQLHRDLKRMVAAWEEFEFDYALSKDACASFGGCTFLPMCRSPHPEQWLNQYRIRRWDPLSKDFGEKLLEHPGVENKPGSDDLEINIKDLM